MHIYLTPYFASTEETMVMTYRSIKLVHIYDTLQAWLQVSYTFFGDL